MYPAHLLCSDCLTVLGPSSCSCPDWDLCTCWGAVPHRSKAVSFSSFRFGLKCPSSEQPSLLTQLKLPHPCFLLRHPIFSALGHLSAPGINHWLCWSLCSLPVFPITRSCLSLYWSQNNRLTLSRSSMKVCWLNTKKECASYLLSVALYPIFACLRA